MSLNLIFAISLFFISALTLVFPALSPARFLFGVRVSQPFRRTEPGRRARRLYYSHEHTGILHTIGIAAAVGTTHIWLWYLAGILPPVFAAIGYNRASRHLRPFAAPSDAPAVREADLSLEPDRLPRFTLLGFPPFLLPVAGALWVRAHWNEIPAHIPIHYGIDGQPNGWTTRTPLHLYGWFIFITGMLLLLFAMSVVGYHGARRSPARRTMLAMMISIMYPMSLIFGGVGVWVAHHFNMWIVLAILPPFVAGMVWWNHVRARDPQPSADATPDECWSTGDVYNNPDDPALFVPKRLGYGYTINFGNPAGKWVCAGFLSGIGLMIAFLFWMRR